MINTNCVTEITAGGADFACRRHASRRRRLSLRLAVARHRSASRPRHRGHPLPPRHADRPWPTEKDSHVPAP